MSESQQRSGSPTFYRLLDILANLHEKKSHDYASTANPVGNYHFAGLLANMFSYSSQDAGFIGRIGEKIYRLSNLEKDGKKPRNESIEDTEQDICVITLLWMADRQERRTKMGDGYAAGTAESVFVQNVNKDNSWTGLTSIAPPERDEKRNPFQEELFDLIKLMPDYQTDEIVEFIMSMRRARHMARSSAKQA